MTTHMWNISSESHKLDAIKSLKRCVNIKVYTIFETGEQLEKGSKMDETHNHVWCNNTGQLLWSEWWQQNRLIAKIH